MTARASASGGFTLVEVLVAMTILTTGMLSILALFASSVAIHREALDAAHVERIVDATLAELRAEAETGRDPSGFAERESSAYPAYRVSAEVEPLEGVAGAAFAVRITVTFVRSGRDVQESVEAVVVKDDFAARVEAAAGGRSTTRKPR